MAALPDAASWRRPHPVTDLDLAFPARALEIMPTRNEAEAGLRLLDAADREKWLHFQRTMFISGLPKTFEVVMQDCDGEKVDGTMAFRHLRVIQGSFAPQHEHKEAAVAWLASLWFVDYSFVGFANDPRYRVVERDGEQFLELVSVEVSDS